MLTTIQKNNLWKHAPTNFCPATDNLVIISFQKEANTWFTGRRDLRARVDVITCIVVKYNPVNVCIVRMSITIGLPWRNHRSRGLVHARLRTINEHQLFKWAHGRYKEEVVGYAVSIFAMRREQDASIEMEKRRWFIIAKCVILLP